MKSKRNFQKSKKSNSFEQEREIRIKKIGSSKKKKNFKNEIFAEMDEDQEELDLFGKDEDSFDEEDSDG